MILYKYVDLETAYLILDNHTFKFTNPYNLNDPFEVSSLHYESESRKYHAEENTLNNIAISDSYGILSLSRSPLNPLMWAHYSKGRKLPYQKGITFNSENETHGGMVIGIDTEKADFNSICGNVIPAQHGSVIYTTIKPTETYPNSACHYLLQGLEHQYKFENFEALQRIFLHKSSHWSYEEEVRVVRNVSRCPEGKFGNKQIMEVAKESIVQIYIGSAHAYPRENAEELYKKIKASLPHCEVWLCNTEGKTWDINAEIMS